MLQNKFNKHSYALLSKRGIHKICNFEQLHIMCHTYCTVCRPSSCTKDTTGPKKEVQLYTLKATQCKCENICIVLYISEGTRTGLRKIGPVTFRLLPKPDNSLPSPAHFLLKEHKCYKCYKWSDSLKEHKKGCSSCFQIRHLPLSQPIFC